MTDSSQTTNSSTQQTEKAKSPNGSGPQRPGSSETPQTITPPDLRENVLKKLAYIKLGERGYQMVKDQGRQRLVERLVKKTQDGTLGKVTEEDKLSNATDGEDMSFKLGDSFETHHHYTQQQQQPAATSNGNSSLAKWALAAGLLASGLGGGALAASLLKSPPSSPPASADSDTRYGLKVYEGE